MHLKACWKRLSIVTQDIELIVQQNALAGFQGVGTAAETVTKINQTRHKKLANCPGMEQKPKLKSDRHKLILFVDDEAIFRELARKVLFRNGYRVLLASNGAEAVSVFTKHLAEVRLVITDISMPVMDGVALVRALKTLNPAVCIIVSSGLATDEAMKKAKESGSSGFIQKPYTAETLLKIVDKSLSR